MSQVLKLSYLLLDVALTSQVISTIFQKSLSSLTPFIRLEKSLILQVIFFKPCQLLSFQTSMTSLIEVIIIPSNSRNAQVASSRFFTVESTKKPSLLTLRHYFCARIHRILARKTKVTTLSNIGRCCFKLLNLKKITS